MFALTGGMVNAVLDCREQNLGLMCFAEPDSAYKAEWSDCLFGDLTDEEQVWSNKIVKAWTNFAVHGLVRKVTLELTLYSSRAFFRTPTPAEETNIPPLEKFDISNPSYLAFRPNGPVIAKQSYADTFPLSATNDDTSPTTSPTTTDSTGGLEPG
jgi:hypothetical protein